MSRERKGGWGGARPGSGPKRREGPFIRHTVLLTDEQVEMLREWGGGDLSRGLRWLMASAAPLVGPAVVSIPRPTPPSP